MVPAPMIEGFYVESDDGLFFAVKGLIHPPRTVVAYLRYAPDPKGDRTKGNLRYRRLYHFEEQEELLRGRHPAYLFFDPVFGEQLQGVPHERAAQVYDPCRKLAELRGSQGLDEPEEMAVEFGALLAERAEVPDTCIGLSGSILVGLHTPHSDADIVVYGSEPCRAVQRALRELLDQPAGEVRRLDRREMEALFAARSQDTPMGLEDFARLEGRKVIQGRFRGREYFIRFVKAPAEVEESYGERRYVVLGQAEIEATVADASQALFTPCTYGLEDVQCREAQLAGGQQVVLLPREIVSFRGRFCEQAGEGERVIARGKLEKVLAGGGKTWHRLLLGGPGDSMIVKNR